MLKAAHQAGAAAALEHFGVKEAVNWGGIGQKMLGYGKGMGRMMVGHPDQFLSEVASKGIKAPFQEGGMLNMKDVLWPSLPQAGMKPLHQAEGWKLVNAQGPHAAGTKLTEEMVKGLKQQGMSHVNVAPTGMQHAGAWANRAFNVGLPALEMYSALKGDGDPNEGRLSNTLGALGSGLGFAYGFPVGGALGAPILGNAGRSLGQGLGRMLGSHPTPRPSAPPDPNNYPGGY